MGRKDLEMSTHTTLFNNGDFSLHARLSAVVSPAGGYALSFFGIKEPAVFGI